MSIWRSFKGQVGRDTGKALSNFLWGDRHASVYRRAESRKLEFKRQQLLDNEQRQIKHENLKQLADKTDDKIQTLSLLTISNDRSELLNTLGNLAMLLKTYPIKDITLDASHRISNSYSDAVLAKYEQVFVTFSLLYPDDSMITYYTKVLKSANRLRFFKRYMCIILGLTLLLILIFLIKISE